MQICPKIGIFALKRAKRPPGPHWDPSGWQKLFFWVARIGKPYARKKNFWFISYKKKLACPNHAVGHPIGFFDPPKCPLGVIFGPPKILQYYSWIARIPKPNVEKKIFEKIFLTHPTKPLAAILYFGELGEKLNAQRKKIFGASKLGQKTTFKRYPFLKSSEKFPKVPRYVPNVPIF